MSGNTPPKVYPPGAMPMPQSTMAPAGAPPGALSGAPPPSALDPGASLNNLLQALIPQGRPPIQRPVFAAPTRQNPLPAGYPAPTYVDPVMHRIKYMTDTFHAAATNDPIFYKIYCDVRNAESPYSAFPNLGFFLRLHLQVSWIDLLERHHRQNEVEGDTTRLIQERKDLIEYLVQHDKTLKPRAGQYLTGRLARFGALHFDPRQVSPLVALLDHLYVLENRLFFGPQNIRAPARSEYRIQVVTYLDYEGGEAKIVEDVNISQRISVFELHDMLSTLTRNIQAAQFDYNYGFQSGGYHGHWVYWANKTGDPYGWARALDSEAQLGEMKDFLDEGLKIIIKHVSHSFTTLPSHSIQLSTSFTLAPDLQHLFGSSQHSNNMLTFDGIQTKQIEVEENLQVADALGLGLGRPFEWCIPLPPGYTSVIMGEYPNSKVFSLLSGGSAEGGPAPAVEHTRGERSVLAHQHQVWLRKQKQKNQKARAFEIRGKRA